MTVATYNTAGNYPKKLNNRESKVIEAARNGLISSGAASIVNADISATAEIEVSKLKDGTAYQIIQTDAAGTGVEWTTITDNNIDAAAAIAVTKLAFGTANHVLKTNSGATANEFGLLANANIDAAAAIVVTKLAIGSANQVIKTNSGGTANEFGLIANANIDSAAAISLSKLAEGVLKFREFAFSSAVVAGYTQLSFSDGAGVATLVGTAIPSGSYIVAGYLNVIEAFTADAGDANVAIKAGIEDQDNDLIASAALNAAPWNAIALSRFTGTEGLALDINDPTKFIATTGSRQLNVTVTDSGAATALVNGKAKVGLLFIQPA